jgi:serine/threonine protein kinase/Tol biopolymer transport system component
VSAIGSGGMGEVYRAQDTRLRRVVALKTLSQRLESNPQAIERFEREARAAASLNHPNICTIYDVGTDPPFIAMELLEGETLQQRLRRGPMDVMTVVDVTLGLVDALEAAHAQGILHRDIKPANIFLTRRGPKILDFGLAKAVPASAEADGTGSMSRPIESLLTDEGTAVGTVAYMSPEQLRGQPLDARTDLFSLGLVLYEMATGRPAFAGETSAVIAAAILQEMPVPPRHVREDVPARLEDIILKTIEKDPRDRTQTASELRADLRRFKRELESGPTPVREPVERPSGTAARAVNVDRPRSGSTQVLVNPPRRRGAFVFGATVLAVTMAGLGFLVWQQGWLSTDTPTNALLQNAQISQVTATGDAWRPAMSPDGRFVVYVRRDGVIRSLRVRQLGTDRDVELVAPEPDVILQAATVTPDGSFVDFVRGKPGAPTLWRVPFLGGSPRRVLDNVNSPIGWSPDGRQFAFVRAGFDGPSALLVADADGTNERTVAMRALPAQFLSFGMLATPSGQGASIHPAWSPDGKTLALIGFEPVGEALIRQAVFVDVATGAQRSIPLRDNASADGIEWLDESHLLVSQMGDHDAVAQLWVLSSADGEWSRLTNDLSNYASFSVSADRQSIAAERWDHRVGISVMEGTSGTPSDVVPADPFVGVDLTWAGDRLLYARLSPADNRPAVWALRQGQSNPEELIANASSPHATADGRTIVFSKAESAGRRIARADGDGRNAVEVGTAAGDRTSLTVDGKQLIYVSSDSGTQSVWLRPLDGGKPTQLADVFGYHPAPSPDGKLIAFVSVDDQRRAVISICALPDCASRRSFPAVRSPAAVEWTPDGRGVAYAVLANIWVQPADGSAPSQLTHLPEDGRRIEDFEWSADGRRLAFSRSKRTWDIVLFRGVSP